MSRIHLMEPAGEYAEDIWAFRQEILQHDAANEDQFAGCLSLDRCETPEEWIRICRLRKHAASCCQSGTAVPAHMFLAVREDDNRIVGIIDLRHHIDHPILGTWGGHIGYSVHPDERRRGYATRMLQMDLENARRLGLARVLVTCDESNIASEKTIRKNGGVYENMVPVDGRMVKRFWIEL